MTDVLPAPAVPSPAAPASAEPAARGSTFYTAMRLLPRAQREGMFEVYAFCRAVDDVADEGGTRAERRAGLARWRTDIDALYAGRPPAALAALAGAVHRFSLRREDFQAVIDGMAMDAEADIRAPDWPTLDLYCDRVASAVGRLSVRIFGTPEAQGLRLAHHLGRALQLTNILRDLDEDAGLGRLYLPREALRDAGIPARLHDDPAAVLAHPGLAAACAPVLARARQHFTAAWSSIGACPRGTTKAPRLMAAAYGGLLDRVAARGFQPPRARVRLGGAAKLAIVLRHGLL